MTGFRVMCCAAVLSFAAACGSTVAGSGTATSTASRATPAGETTSGAAYETIELTWNTGSVPPPYNYTLNLHVTGASAEFTWRANYADPEPTWTDTFQLDDGSLVALHAAVTDLLAAGSADHADLAVGGAGASVNVVTADGSTQERTPLAQERVDDVEDLIVATVPTDMYRDAEAEFTAWQATQE